MSKSMPRRIQHLTPAMLILACGAAAPAIEIDVTWTGAAGNGLWSDVNNWDPPMVPANDGVDEYNVFIPSGQAVILDMDDPIFIRDLDLGTNASLEIRPGHRVEVLDDARINGVVTANNGTFIAAFAGASFSGANARMYASGEAYVRSAATSYAPTSAWSANSTLTILSADGAGSRLDLFNLQSLNSGFNDGRSDWTTVQRIAATNGATIDLSSLQSINAPSRGEDRLDILISNDGTIDLSSLQTITSASAGNVRFDVDRPSFALNALQSATDTWYDLEEGATIDLPALTTQNLATFTLRENTTANVGSLISLTNSSVSMSDGATFDAPNLVDFAGSSVTLTGARTFNTGTLTNINDTALAAISGGVLGSANNAVAATDLVTTGRWSANTFATLLNADGAGSLLDLSSLQSINAGYNDGRSDWTTTQRFVAANGGVIDLSGVLSIEAPDRSEDRLDIIINDGGTIDLSSLQTLISDSVGDTRFNINVPNYALPALESASNAQFRLEDGATLDLAALTSHVSGSYTLADNSTVNAPNLLSLNSASLSLAPGSSFNAASLVSLASVSVSLADGVTLDAPNVVDFNGGTVTLTPARTFNTGAITNIDNAVIYALDGASFGTSEIAATGLVTTGRWSANTSVTLFNADGAGSLLDLSSLQSINAGYNDGRSDWTTTQRIVAANGGTVDLSGVLSIEAPDRSEDRLDIIINDGGTIDLSSLQTIISDSVGDVRFDINVPGYGLPTLETANHTQFHLETGTTLDLPLITAHNSGNYTVPENASVSANSLLSMNSVSLTLAEGSAFNAPMLVEYTTGSVSLTTNTTFTTGTLLDIDNTIMSLTAGATWGTGHGNLNATSYTTTGRWSANSTVTLLSADGTGTVLDLSSIESINAGFNDGRNDWTTVQRISATDNAHIDFSGLLSIRSPNRSQDRIDFVVDSGASMDFSSLQQVSSASSGDARFIIGGTASMTFGSLLVGRDTVISLTDVTSRLTINGSLLLDSGSLSIATGSEVSIGKHMTYGYTSETSLNASTGILRFEGTGTQFLEVGGFDVGPIDPSNNGNFGFGQLVVGTDTDASRIQLVDLFDNGNRPGEDPEALYLFGLGGPDGLIILSGSTLIIDNLNVYTTENGDWVHLNSLFGPGDTIIPYGDGFVKLPAPGTGVLLGLGLLAATRRRRTA